MYLLIKFIKKNDSGLLSFELYDAYYSPDKIDGFYMISDMINGKYTDTGYSFHTTKINGEPAIDYLVDLNKYKGGNIEINSVLMKFRKKKIDKIINKVNNIQ